MYILIYSIHFFIAHNKMSALLYFFEYCMHFNYVQYIKFIKILYYCISNFSDKLVCLVKFVLLSAVNL